MCGVWINKVSPWIGATWEYVLKFGLLDLLGHVILEVLVAGNVRFVMKIFGLHLPYTTNLNSTQSVGNSSLKVCNTCRT